MEINQQNLSVLEACLVQTLSADKNARKQGAAVTKFSIFHLFGLSLPCTSSVAPPSTLALPRCETAAILLT